MPTMLVIDDDEEIRQLVAMLFGDEGYTVESASSVAEGISMLRRLRPSIIVLDLRLNDGDGSEIASACRSDPTLQRIPIVVMSASRYEQDHRDDNVAAVFEKPFDVDHLCRTVEALISQERGALSVGSCHDLDQGLNQEDALLERWGTLSDPLKDRIGHREGPGYAR